MNHKQYNNDEITLRELILKIREYFLDIMHNWRILILFVLPFILYMGAKNWFETPDYHAPLSFMINEDSGNPLGSIGSMLGSFGIGTKGKNNLARVLELSKSRKIVENALFNKVEINDSTQYLANHLITNLDTLKKWVSKPWFKSFSGHSAQLKGFYFTHDSIDGFDETEKMALKKLYGHISGNKENGTSGVMETDYNEESRILNLDVKSSDQMLSISLCNNVFDELSAFYIAKTIEKQLTTYTILKNKTDSLKMVLMKKENQLAYLEDSFMGVYSNKSKLQKQRLTKDIRMLTLALGESIKNVEIADFALKNTTPYIQVIDRPISPLAAKKSSLIKQLLIGIIFGLITGSLFVSFRKIFRDALAG